VEIRDARVWAGSASVAFAEIARVASIRPERLPPGEDPGLHVTAVYEPSVSTGAYSYGTHAVVVAVDPERGMVELLDYVVVHDCGTVVNPMIVDGQLVGGVVQGIGTALYEEIPYDEYGQPLASTFMDYLLPGATEVPNIRLAHMNTPSPHTAFGIKGMGEGGAIGPPGAILNAINDALRPLGAEVNETPVTPRRLRAAIRARSSK
jgi:carbon-monoxide dehydrogenase large subunit